MHGGRAVETKSHQMVGTGGYGRATGTLQEFMTWPGCETPAGDFSHVVRAGSA